MVESSASRLLGSDPGLGNKVDILSVSPSVEWG